MRTLVIAILMAVTPTVGFAWSNQGHMATGAIAYDTLMAGDPSSVDKIVALMAQHPDHARFERALADTAGPTRTRRLFEQMARWPDDIRETPWSQPEWHYRARIVAGWPSVMTFSVGEAHTAFALNLAIVRDPKRPASERAVALCWVFHILGDMHQPLHAGHRMDWRFPLTDRLGTIAYVRTAEGADPRTFHDLWDEALDRPGTDVAGAETIAAMAAHVRPLAISASGGFDQWFNESKALAATRAYGPETMQGTRSPDAAPVLSAPYLRGMREIAIVRITQAGRRLAAMFQQDSAARCADRVTTTSSTRSTDRHARTSR